MYNKMLGYIKEMGDYKASKNEMNSSFKSYFVLSLGICLFVIYNIKYFI
jgi:hypothetical protein